MQKYVGEVATGGGRIFITTLPVHACLPFLMLTILFFCGPRIFSEAFLLFTTPKQPETQLIDYLNNDTEINDKIVNDESFISHVKSWSSQLGLHFLMFPFLTCKLERKISFRCLSIEALLTIFYIKIILK